MGQMRAAHLQENVRAIGRLGEGVLARVRARVPQVVGDIEGALRPTWLDARLDVELTEALCREAGVDVVRRVNRAAIAESVNGPLLGPLRDGIVRVLGLSPASALKWWPRGWPHIYKDFGEASWDVDAHTLTIRALPRFALESTGWCEGCAGAVQGIVDVAGGRDARVDVERRLDEGAAEGALVLKVGWS